MKKLAHLLCLIALSLPATAQNIGSDIQRILRLAPEARDSTEVNNPALDTIVATLAYYGGMPNDELVTELLSGPKLLAHYANNAVIRKFLLDEQLDVLLEGYAPSPELTVPDFIAAANRKAFLRSLEGSELFSQNGLVDLRKIRETFTSPPSVDFSLKAAASSAANQSDAPSTSLISNAIAGLSDWISRRAQEELTYTFLNKLRDDIQRNDLNFLFPKTSSFLPSLDLLNYRAILPSIRKAFTEDLNAITFNLGKFLEEKDQVSYRDPATYNVFLIYRILDLNMRDVPLADILSFTYSELERARVDTRCQIDLKMAQADTTNPAYNDILATFDEYVMANENLNRQFKEANDLLSEEYFNPILDATQAEDFPPSRADSFITRAATIFLPLDAEKLPLRNNYWKLNNEPPATGIVQAWLRGKEPYSYYEAYPSLTRFDELFGADATIFNPQERRAAGLTAVRETLTHRNALDDYNDQLNALIDARSQLIAISTEISGQRLDDSLAKISLEDQKFSLLADIDEELSSVEPDQRPALQFLHKITESIPTKEKNASSLLSGTRMRLIGWVQEQGNADSPLAQKMDRGPIGAADLPPLQEAIDNTEAAYNSLSDALRRYSNNQVDSLVQTYQNLTTFETVFGLAQQVFFLLSESNSDLFLDKSQMAIFQTDPSAKLLLAGIARERIGRVSSLGKINAAGVTDFLLDFSLYLSDFRESLHDPKMEELTERQFLRVKAVSFIANTIQSLLEAPILQHPSQSNQVQSLAERYPAFSDVPAVSQEINTLFQRSTKGEYRYAIENLVNLIKLFNIIPDANKKQQRLARRRDKLKTQISALSVNQDPTLQTIGLATPAVDEFQLEVKLSKQNKAKLMAYSSEISAATSSTEREKAAQNITNLKVETIRKELKIVEAKLAKLHPKRIDRFQKNFFRYGTFMADVAAANDATEFQAALNTIALQRGSSQTKRIQASTLELGAYFGLALSQERLILPPGIDAPELEEDVFGAALFVPVGISYSTNIGGSKSMSLFASLIDLGAITAFRLESKNSGNGNPEIERLPEFELTNIIAPGVHLMYNFPKSPFTLGFGVQDGPSVRKFTLAGDTIERQARSVRTMVTFSVDVPIFRFFSR